MSTFIPELMNLFTPLYLALIIFGVTLGIVFGSVPGLSPSMCIALFLPMSFSMDLHHSMLIKSSWTKQFSGSRPHLDIRA